MAQDIRETGPVGLKGLQGLNRQHTEDNLPSSEEIQRERRRVLTGSSGPVVADTRSTISYGAGTPMGDWGTSQYDDEILNTPMSEGELQDAILQKGPPAAGSK